MIIHAYAESTLRYIELQPVRNSYLLESMRSARRVNTSSALRRSSPHMRGARVEVSAFFYARRNVVIERTTSINAFVAFHA